MAKLEIFRDGEFYLIQRGGSYHIHGTWRGERVRKGCRTKNLNEAKMQLERLRLEYSSGWRDSYDGPDVDWRVVAGLIHHRHRRSAVERGIPFDLEAQDVFGLMKATDFRCAVSGVAFSKQPATGGWRDPWAPSLDRIENRQGYAADNVRVVALIANTAMNAWGYDTLLRLARGVVRSSATVAAEPHELTRFEHNQSCVTAQVIELKGKS